MTIESIASIAALAIATISAISAARLGRANRLLSRRVDDLNSRVRELSCLPSATQSDESCALSGLVIAVGVVQDHAAAPFARLLRDALHAADADVRIVSQETAAQMTAQMHSDDADEAPDVVIRGTVTCNGYSDIFYRAGLTFTTRFGELNPLNELPAQGAPQNSLCVETMSRLIADLPLARLRSERTAALRELRSDSLLHHSEV